MWLVAAVASILVGLALLIFHVQFARKVVEEQNRLWGFHFGDTEAHIAEVITLVVGLGFVAWGLLLIYDAFTS